MIRPTVARIDLSAIKANFRAIAQHLAQEASAAPPGIIAVVKAHAYGHGAGQAGRAAGVKAQILIFGALSVSDLDGLFDCRLTPTISTPGAARAVQAAAQRYNQRLRYHLKIATGMNRLDLRV